MGYAFYFFQEGALLLFFFVLSFFCRSLFSLTSSFFILLQPLFLSSSSSYFALFSSLLFSSLLLHLLSLITPSTLVLYPTNAHHALSPLLFKESWPSTDKKRRYDIKKGWRTWRMRCRDMGTTMLSSLLFLSFSWLSWPFLTFSFSFLLFYSSIPSARVLLMRCKSRRDTGIVLVCGLYASCRSCHSKMPLPLFLYIILIIHILRELGCMELFQDRWRTGNRE